MDSSISSEKEWEVCNKKMKNIKQYLDLTFWKFILVGIINTLVGTTVMFVAYNLCHLNYWVSSASNYVVGSIVSYFLNKYFTFQDKKKSWRQVGIFGLAKPFVNWILAGQATVVRDNVSMLVGMGAFVVFNYLGQRMVVFKR